MGENGAQPNARGVPSERCVSQRAPFDEKRSLHLRVLAFLPASPPSPRLDFRPSAPIRRTDSVLMPMRY